MWGREGLGGRGRAPFPQPVYPPSIPRQIYNNYRMYIIFPVRGGRKIVFGGIGVTGIHRTIRNSIPKCNIIMVFVVF